MTLLFTGSLKILCPLLLSSFILSYFHFYILTMLLHSFKHLSTVIQKIYIKIFKWKKCHGEDYSKRFLLTWNCLCLVTAIHYSSVIFVFVLLHPVVLALFNTLPFYLHIITCSNLLSLSFHVLSIDLHNDLSSSSPPSHLPDFSSAMKFFLPFINSEQHVSPSHNSHCLFTTLQKPKVFQNLFFLLMTADIDHAAQDLDCKSISRSLAFYIISFLCWEGEHLHISISCL